MQLLRQRAQLPLLFTQLCITLGEHSIARAASKVHICQSDIYMRDIHMRDIYMRDIYMRDIYMRDIYMRDSDHR